MFINIALLPKLSVFYYSFSIAEAIICSYGVTSNPSVEFYKYWSNAIYDSNILLHSLSKAVCSSCVVIFNEGNILSKLSNS